MEEICVKYLFSFRKENNSVSGVIKSEDDYNMFFDELRRNGYEYSVRSSKTINNLQDLAAACTSSDVALRIDKTTGAPCIQAKVIDYQCSHGEKYYESRPNTEDRPGRKRKFRVQATKKWGCASKVNVKVKYVIADEIFDGLEKKSKRYRTKVYSDLKTKLKGETLYFFTWFFVELQLKHNHTTTTSEKQKPFGDQNLVKLREVLKSLTDLTYEVPEGEYLTTLVEEAEALKAALTNYIRPIKSEDDTSLVQKTLKRKNKLKTVKSESISKNPTIDVPVHVVPFKKVKAIELLFQQQSVVSSVL